MASRRGSTAGSVTLLGNLSSSMVSAVLCDSYFTVHKIQGSFTRYYYLVHLLMFWQALICIHFRKTNLLHIHSFNVCDTPLANNWKFFHLRRFGYWILVRGCGGSPRRRFNLSISFSDVGTFLYYSLFTPLLYYCFLYEFFRDINLPSYYQEMIQQGYLDTDT